MADIRAFRAFRYDLGRVGLLSNVVAPPYDVINAAEQQKLYDASPYNVIRLILGQQNTDDTEGNNRYTRAAQTLRDWQHEDALVQDSARGLYVYQQEYEVEGTKYNRAGFLARVRLEKFGEGRIYPHEQTMSGPKADRLKLFHATGMNLSPIFGLYPDEGLAVRNMLDQAITNKLPLEAIDSLGVVNRLWPVTDEQIVSQISGMMSNHPIFIADGHHRYETSLKYLQEQQEAGEATDPEHPANFTLMMLVGMNDPGLLILPTHRLVTGIPGLTTDMLQGILAPAFDCEVVGKGESAAQDTWEKIELDGGQTLFGFGTVSDGTWISARFKAPEQMAKVAADHSDAWQGLAVSVLHELVLNKLIAEKMSTQPQCRFVHLMSEVNESVADKSCDLAALIPPATMKHVEDIAGHLEKMPPKSTYFFPKLLSGLVFNSLKVN